MKKTMLRKVQSLAKGHEASRSVHNLSKNPVSQTPRPVIPEAASHYNANRIGNRCLLVNSLSQGKVVLKQKFKTLLYNLQAVQNLTWLRVQKFTLKPPWGTALVLLTSKRQLQASCLGGPVSCHMSPCGRRKSLTHTHTFDNTK